MKGPALASLGRYVAAAAAIVLLIAAGLLAISYGLPHHAGPDRSLSRKTQNGLFAVVMTPSSPLHVGKTQSWLMTVRTAAGQPVENAAIDISGGMVRQLHGLPTSPQVTDYLGQGRYRIDGLKFHLRGWWQVHVAISAAAGSDRVVFDVVL